MTVIKLETRERERESASCGGDEGEGNKGFLRISLSVKITELERESMLSWPGWKVK